MDDARRIDDGKESSRGGDNFGLDEYRYAR